MPIDPTAFAYDVAVMSQDGAMLHLPRGSMVLEEQAEEISATLRCSFPRVMTTHGPMEWLVRPGTPIYAYVVQRGPSGSLEGSHGASSLAGGTPWDPGYSSVGFGGGEGSTELFRGTIETYEESTDNIEIIVSAHDVLQTLVKHNVDATIPAGISFVDAVAQLAAEWGMTMGRVDGPDAIMPEKTWRGQPAGQVLADMLEVAMGEGGGHYIIRATGDAIDIVMPGGNDPVWWLESPGDVRQTVVPHGGGAGITHMTIDITELVGTVQVVSITEHEGEYDPSIGSVNDKAPTLATVKQLSTDAGFNGAVKQVYADSQTSVESAELEAAIELAKSGWPNVEFTHETIDIPNVRRYDKIAISDGILDSGYPGEPLYVLAVTHNASEMSMSLVLQTQEDFDREGDVAMMDAQLAKLRGEEAAAAAWQKSFDQERARAEGVSGSAHDPWQKILDAARPVMGTPYVWGGPGGRSDFSPNRCESDCSGFVTWLCHQLGAPTGVYAFTDNLAQVSQLIGTNSTKGGDAGDFILQVDPSVQAGARTYHVQMYSGEGSTVIEDGGTSAQSGGSRIWIGSIFGNYELRRFAPLHAKLYPEKPKGKK